MKEHNKRSKGKRASGYVFVGCLIIGWAAGVITNMLPYSIFIGLGAGFIGMAIVRLKHD